jgi:putative DNA primase/helicase
MNIIPEAELDRLFKLAKSLAVDGVIKPPPRSINTPSTENEFLYDQSASLTTRTKEINETKTFPLISDKSLAKPSPLQLVINSLDENNFQDTNTDVLKDKLNEENINSDKIIPELLLMALGGVHDDVANFFVITYNKFVKCSDIKHSVIWFWDEKKKLWQEGGIETLVNLIMVHTRPVIWDIYTRQKQIRNNNEKEENRCKNLLNLYKKMGDVNFVCNIAKLVKERTYDDTIINNLDSNNDLLPIKNGKVINLRTKEIRNRTMDDYFTFECPIEYDYNANSQIITSFINDITLGDESLKLFLQEVFGSCLTGHIHNKYIYILFGPKGMNGKTTVINMMAKILGSFFKVADRDIFLKAGSHGKNIDPFLAELRGVRMTVFCEVEDGDKINEGLIKRFTGGDKIIGKPLYKSPIQFDPHCKCFILTNNKPECSMDQATWQRNVMIPFNCYYTDNPIHQNERLIDPHFKDTILEDNSAMNAFFKWLVDGAYRTYNSNLVIPKCVKDTTKTYKEDQDLYARFVESKVIIDESGNNGWKISASELYSEFRYWCKEDEGIVPPSQTKFGTNIKRILKDFSRSNRGINYNNCKLLNGEQNCDIVTMHTNSIRNKLKIPMPINNLSNPPGTISL